MVTPSEKTPVRFSPVVSAEPPSPSIRQSPLLRSPAQQALPQEIDRLLVSNVSSPSKDQEQDQNQDQDQEDPLDTTMVLYDEDEDDATAIIDSTMVLYSSSESMMTSMNSDQSMMSSMTSDQSMMSSSVVDQSMMRSVGPEGKENVYYLEEKNVKQTVAPSPRKSLGRTVKKEEGKERERDEEHKAFVQEIGEWGRRTLQERQLLMLHQAFVHLENPSASPLDPMILGVAVCCLGQWISLNTPKASSSNGPTSSSTSMTSIALEVFDRLLLASRSLSAVDHLLLFLSPDSQSILRWTLNESFRMIESTFDPSSLSNKSLQWLQQNLMSWLGHQHALFVAEMFRDHLRHSTPENASIRLKMCLAWSSSWLSSPFASDLSCTVVFDTLRPILSKMVKDGKNNTRTRRQAAECIGLLEPKARDQKFASFQKEQQTLISTDTLRQILLSF